MTPHRGRIAAVVGGDGAKIQALLAEMAAEWRARGARIVGVIAEAHGLPDRTCGAGFLRDIASGEAHTIYLDVAPSNTSCHLDTAGVVGAGAAIINQVATSDLVILNKFGKLEAMGSGLAGVFAAAIASGKPLLTTVSEKQRGAWCAYAPGAIFLTADKSVLEDWWRAMRAIQQPHSEQQPLGGRQRSIASAVRSS
jgi:nucleoside-triphosphatase THEP1